MVWRAGQGEAATPFRVKVAPSMAEHLRHRSKYAEGALIPEEHFVFRGPEGRLNLRAQKLVIFSQLAEGVEDDT